MKEQSLDTRTYIKAATKIYSEITFGNKQTCLLKTKRLIKLNKQI